jgi:hypothetical protein
MASATESIDEGEPPELWTGAAAARRRRFLFGLIEGGER